MVLLHLMQKLEHPIGVAHFDHLTRNGQSTKDMKFVKGYCKKNNIEFHTRKMDKSIKYKNFHDEAHKQRYAFFNELGYTKIITGHHQDDNAETILLNMFNGKSVSGINDKHLNIRRPLLAFTKTEIETYAKNNNVEYVEDISNFESQYDRNYIRNKLIPIIKQNFNNADSKIINLSQRLLKRDKAFFKLSEKNLNPKSEKDYTSINKALIKDLGKISEEVLSHYLSKFNFNHSQAKDIVASLDNIGSSFINNKYEIVVDRQDIRIYKKSEPLTNIEVKLSDTPIHIEYGNYIIKFEKTSEFQLNTAKNIAQVGNSLIKNTTLIIRPWREGDIFYPINMNGKKQSLKKYFTNLKVDRIQKKKIPIFTTQQNEILWIGGYRQDDRFKVKEGSNSILKISLLPK